MSTIYMECPECRRRALAVATRCPHCGAAFPSRPLRRSTRGPDLARMAPVLGLAGVLVAAVVLVGVLVRGKGARTGSAAMPPPDSSAAVPAPVLPAPPVPPPTPAAGPSVPRAALGAPAAAAPGAAVQPQAPGQRRYALTWTNVRTERRRLSARVAVLNPGDSVLADSLRGGWYRVTVDGRALGYVYRETLASSRPPAGGRP